jgi:hypothetical protein
MMDRSLTREAGVNSNSGGRLCGSNLRLSSPPHLKWYFRNTCEFFVEISLSPFFHSEGGNKLHTTFRERAIRNIPRLSDQVPYLLPFVLHQHIFIFFYT